MMYMIAVEMTLLVAVCHWYVVLIMRTLPSRHIHTHLPSNFQEFKKGRRKGKGRVCRPSTGNGRNVSAVRMECNYTMCGSDMQNKLGAVSSPAIEKAVHYCV